MCTTQRQTEINGIAFVTASVHDLEILDHANLIGLDSSTHLLIEFFAAHGWRKRFRATLYFLLNQLDFTVLDTRLDLSSQFLHSNITRDLVPIDMHLSVVQVDLQFAWLLGSPEAAEVNLEAWA